MIHYSDKNSAKRKFEQIYASYSGRIYNFVLRISHGNEYLAEEITQTTFLKLWEKRDALIDEAATQSYIYSIARNLFLNYCEHETIEYVYYNYIMRCSTDQDCTTESQLTRDFLNDFLLKIIDELPPQQRKVFILSKLEGKTTKQIAEEISISCNTVERHMTLALRHIKERMLKYYNVLIPAILTTLFYSIS